MSNLLITEAGCPRFFGFAIEIATACLIETKFSLLAERKRQSCGRRGRSWRRLAQLSFIADRRRVRVTDFGKLGEHEGCSRK